MDIVDVKGSRVVGSVTGLLKIRGIALSPDPNVVFTSNAAAGTVTAIDVSKRQVVKTINIGREPDAIMYDAANDIIVVSMGAGRKVDLIDRTTFKLLGSVDTPGVPELMDMDQKAGRVFLAINDKDEVVVIDVASRQITTTYKGCDIAIPTGVAYEPDQGRLYVASRPGNNRELNVIDIVLDRCLGAVDIGFGTDQIAINPHTHHIYAANGGSKNMSVIDINSLKPLGVVGTGPEAKGLAVDPTTDRVYVIVGRAGMIAVFHDP